MSGEILYRNSGLVRADNTDNPRHVYGTAVPYGEVVEISERGRSYRESFAHGVFARSIKERGHKVRLMIGHDNRRLPIGRAVELTETVEGLQVVFETVDTTDARDALTAVQAGLVDSFSVGFRPIRDRQDKGVLVRTEASLTEVSLVANPAYSGALVGGIRSDTPLITVDRARKRFELLLESF
ncbi:HK97 family phage prohead protease [Rhodococcus opacus]|uniref:HK97 family phage prohead protease n=1 Tax=Rhodococcus opacus TaxID=37919 RepID=UPI00155A9C7D|nr:HK97 family phage prohead protease [Rhodococcus opacus]